MGIRLLQKTEIDRSKAVEQKRAVDEGVKLATNVDTLRRLEAEEKARITKWRDATLDTIKRETEQASAELNGIKAQIPAARAELARMVKPLDEEWAKVRAKQDELAKREGVIAETEKVLQRRAATTADEWHQAQLDRGRAADLKKRASEALATATAKLKDATADAAIARGKAEGILAGAKALEKEVEQKSLAVAIRERDVQNRDAGLILREKAVIVRERQLRDREQTLARNMQRLNLDHV